MRMLSSLAFIGLPNAILNRDNYCYSIIMVLSEVKPLPSLNTQQFMIWPQGRTRSFLQVLCFGFVYLPVSEHLIWCEDALSNLPLSQGGRERESRSLCNTIIPGFEVFKKWHLGIVWRFAAKLHEWVIRYYTVFSLLCSYLGFQMLMMMHLKNITQMWKKRNQKLITNRWVSVSSDFLRSSKNSEAFGTRWGQVVPR